MVDTGLVDTDDLPDYVDEDEEGNNGGDNGGAGGGLSGGVHGGDTDDLPDYVDEEEEGNDGGHNGGVGDGDGGDDWINGGGDDGVSELVRPPSHAPTTIPASPDPRVIRRGQLRSRRWWECYRRGYLFPSAQSRSPERRIRSIKERQKMMELGRRESGPSSVFESFQGSVASAFMGTMGRLFKPIDSPTIPNDREEEREALEDERNGEEDAMAMSIDRNMPGFRQEWRPLKILGEGGCGKVQAWQYQGDPASNGTFQSEVGKIIVVKYASKSESLDVEVDNLNCLRKADAKHLVSAVLKPNPGKLLFMEYCSGGDLHKEIRNRFFPRKGGQERAYVSEKNLWRTFHCLAQGIMALHYGTETPDYDKMNHRWDPMIHFDLKPQNIMIGPKDDSEHEYQPIYKIGDFGIAKLRSDIPLLNNLAALTKLRKHGTRGWYAPERKQYPSNLSLRASEFTRRWDYHFHDDYSLALQPQPVAGDYSSQCNLWSIGAIMWTLAMLATNLMPLGDGYRSRIQDPSGKLAQGNTYGKPIEDTRYSNSLKVLILRCLMEKRMLRPRHEDLLAATAAGVEASANQPEDDMWDDPIDLGINPKSVEYRLYQTGRFTRRNKRGVELRLSESYDFAADKTPPRSSPRSQTRSPTPSIPRDNIAFPNFSNNLGGPGVNLKRRREPTRSGSSSESSIEARPAKRRRKLKVYGQRNLPQPKLNTRQGYAIGPEPQVVENVPPSGGFVLEIVPPNARDGYIQSRWRVNDPDNDVDDEELPDVNTFTWTPDLIDQYAQRYRSRARGCDYEEGVRNADERPEDMARLELDWENQIALSGPPVDQEGGGQAARLERRRQMALDFVKAEQERAYRLGRARDDATRSVGHTPPLFQGPDVPLQAHVQP